MTILTKTCSQFAAHLREQITQGIPTGRDELDGLVSHLCGLSEAEFVHILGTFPLADQSVKVAVHNAYRDVERGLVK